MPLFKPKNSKSVCSNKNTITLDSKHKSILDELFNSEEVVLPKLKSNLKILKIQYSNTLSIDLKLELADQIDSIKKQINDIKLTKKKYFLDNSRFVFDYYSNKKQSACGNSNSRLLNGFFKISCDESNKDKNIASDVQKYFSNIDSSFLDISNFIVQTDICQKCNAGELIPIDHEGMLVCNNCSISFQFLTENEKPSYKELPNEVCFYAYKRINHFREILAQFQAKETTQIPDEVFENIKIQIRKERLTPQQLTTKRAKDILKKLGYNKYYEHIPFIKDKLGVKPPVMNPELEERLCRLFMDIQSPYAKYCPDDRVNFLNYYYTIYKLCELLDQKEFLPFFPMLKDREKRIEQDEIWKKICEELNWEFIPTI